MPRRTPPAQNLEPTRPPRNNSSTMSRLSGRRNGKADRKAPVGLIRLSVTARGYALSALMFTLLSAISVSSRSVFSSSSSVSWNSSAAFSCPIRIANVRRQP